MGVEHERGRWGEDYAADRMESAGWTILDRNWRAGHAELDLVAVRTGILAFVEVKTRSGLESGGPLEALTWHKRRELQRAARAWLRMRGHAAGPIESIRFDVIGVHIVKGREPGLVHLADAWWIGDG
jgi:putative endonuclease